MSSKKDCLLTIDVMEITQMGVHDCHLFGRNYIYEVLFFNINQMSAECTQSVKVTMRSV